MKKLFYSLLGISALLLAGCSNELDDALKTESPSSKTTTLTAVIPSFQREGGTRMSMSSDLETRTWSAGDKIGLYYNGTESYVSAAFTLKTGGSNVGTFTNEGFSLNPNDSYYVLYPYNPNATAVDAYMNFTNQTQSGNNNADHIAEKGFMLASITTDADSNPSTVNFVNQGSIMQFRYTPGAGTYTSLSVTSNKKKFRTKIRLNMVTGNQISNGSSYTQTLALNNITLANGEELIANLFSAPNDQSASILTVTLTKSNGETISYTHKGKNMQAGAIYEYTDVAPASSSMLDGPAVNVALKTLANGSYVYYTTADTKINQINFVPNSSVTTSTVLSTDESKGEIYADFSGGVLNIYTAAPVFKLNEDASYLFNNMTALTSIVGLEYVDFSAVTNMYFMFRNCRALANLDLSSANTSNVTNYNSMFSNCLNMSNLKLGENFLIGSSATTSTMLYKMSTTSGACTITCMTATKNVLENLIPTVPTFTWVLLDGGGSYEAGGEGYPWG